MQKIVKGLESLSNLIGSTRSVIQEVNQLEQDLDQREDRTQQLIQSLQNGNVTRQTLQELMKEEKAEVNEEDKLVQALSNLLQEDQNELQVLEQIIGGIESEEQNEDKGLQQLKNEIQTMANKGVTKEWLQQVMKHGKTLADVLLDESHEELKASNLSQKLAKELGFSAEEIVNAEKIEKEEEYEEREIEDLAQRINNENLMQMISSLEQHTGNDEKSTEQGRQQIINLIEEAEGAEEELEGATRHTHDEAEMLLQLLRQLKQLTQGSPLENQNFQQNFQNIFGEVQEAEQESEQAYENEEDAEKTEEQAENAAQQTD